MGNLAKYQAIAIFYASISSTKKIPEIGKEKR